MKHTHCLLVKLSVVLTQIFWRFLDAFSIYNVCVVAVNSVGNSSAKCQSHRTSESRKCIVVSQTFSD